MGEELVDEVGEEFTEQWSNLLLIGRRGRQVEGVAPTDEPFEVDVGGAARFGDDGIGPGRSAPVRLRRDPSPSPAGRDDGS